MRWRKGILFFLIFLDVWEAESTSSLIPSLMSLTKSSETESDEVDSEVEERGSLSVELALP